MTAKIALPGRPQLCPVPAPEWNLSYPPPKRRSVYAAAHVAAFGDGTIDWESTMGFREHLWAHGFGVAEAMDTAQRGTAIASGVGTDQLAAAPHSLRDIIEAYSNQLELVQASGSRVILMAS